jgi:hypothetical protein
MQQLEITQQQREAILRVAQEYGASNVRVFGSRVHGDARPDSDIDILVEMGPEASLLDVIAIKQDLEDQLGVTVDVLTEKAISKYFREQVLREAVPV